MHMMTRVLTTGALMAIGSTAFAGHLSYFRADLFALNNSGVSGSAFLTYDGPADDGQRTLKAEVRANGVEAGAHAAHIHGFTGADFRPAIAPTNTVFNPATDGDMDGFTELLEGLPFYGGIIQTLTGLTADANRQVDFQIMFDIVAGSDLDSDIFSLDNREIVLHGLTTNFAPIDSFSGTGLGGEIDGFTPAAANFNTLLPIATARFYETDQNFDRLEASAVPLPAAAWMLIAGLAGLGAMRRFGKAAA